MNTAAICLNAMSVCSRGSSESLGWQVLSPVTCAALAILIVAVVVAFALLPGDTAEDAPLHRSEK